MAYDGWTYLRHVIKSQGGILRLQDRPAGATPNDEVCRQGPNVSVTRHGPREINVPTAQSKGSSKPPSGALINLLRNVNNVVVTPTVPESHLVSGGASGIGSHIQHIMNLMSPIAGGRTPAKPRVEEAVRKEIKSALSSVLENSGVRGSERDRTLSGLMPPVETELVKIGSQLNDEQYAEFMVQSLNAGKIVLVQLQVCNFINSRIEVVDVAQAEYVLVS